MSNRVQSLAGNCFSITIPSPINAIPVRVNASPFRPLAISVLWHARVVRSSDRSVLSLAKNRRRITGDRLHHLVRSSPAPSTDPLRVKQGLFPGLDISRTVAPPVGHVVAQSNTFLPVFLAGKYQLTPSMVINIPAKKSAASKMFEYPTPNNLNSTIEIIMKEIPVLMKASPVRPFAKDVL